MEKETRMMLLSRLTKLRLMSRMYEHTFRQAGTKMSEKEMNALLDAKLETDRQIAILEKILHDSEK